MPETTDKTAAQKAQEPAAQAQAEPAAKHGAHSSASHGGAYALVRELAAASGGQEPPPDKLTPIFRKSDYAHPVNDAQKARALTALQQQYGNRYVQRVLSGGVSEPPSSDASAIVQRQEAQGASGGQESSTPQLDQSGGRPLDSGTRDYMGSRFGQDFGGVRVHDDGAAHNAAKSLNADAFTTGRDIYFSQGAYNPSTQSGQKLLAHELAHVAQQNSGAAGAAPQGFRVSHPSDPLERQADAASEAVMRGEMFPALTSSTAPVLHRQAGGGAPAAAPGGAPAGGAPAAAGPKDYSFQIAGTTVVLKDILKRAGVGNKIKVPSHYLRVPVPFFKLTEASIDLDDSKMPTGATVNLAVSKAPLEGTGSVSVDKSGNATGSAHVVFSSSKIPGLKQTELDVTVTQKDFSFDASVDFELPKVTGNLKYKYADQKHSGKGKAGYEGSKLKGEIEIIMSEAGLISGSGKLEMELFKGLKGEVDVAVDEKKNIGVKGKLSVPGNVELFPEKKYEKSFFSFEKKFPIWGITIPVIDVNVGIFAEIHAGAGFRAKFGPGVLRDIALTGEFGTDPEAATEFGLGGEFYVPAGAEVVANVGGGIGLGLAVADITGGIEAVGVAGLYTALTVRPNFAYSGGKYTISGMAELAGVAQLKFGINAFAKIDVGVWLFKGTVWRKDWTLAEWVWNTGLNIALRANISYTLGEDFAPEISFETGQVDPEKFIKDAMPESGSPVPAPPKPPVPEKSTLTAEGAQGQPAGAAPGEAPAPPTPGAPPAKTKPGTAPPEDGKPAGGAPGAKPGQEPAGDEIDDEAKSAAIKEKVSAEVQAHAGDQLGSLAAVDALLSSIYSKYAPEGLASLEVEFDESDPEAFDVLASASVLDEIATLTPKVDKAAWNKLSYKLNPLTAGDTYLFVYVDGAKLPVSPIANIKGGQHAEKVFIGLHLPGIVAQAQAKYKEGDPETKTKLLLQINRSPCGPEEQNCAGSLNSEASKHKKYIDMELSIVGPYGGKFKTEEGVRTFTVPPTTKRAMLLLAQDKSIKLTPLKVWDIFKQKHAYDFANDNPRLIAALLQMEQSTEDLIKYVEVADPGELERMSAAADEYQKTAQIVKGTKGSKGGKKSSKSKKSSTSKKGGTGGKKK